MMTYSELMTNRETASEPFVDSVSPKSEPAGQ